MNNEREFFEELGRTPPLPPELFHGIQGTVNRTARVRKTVLSLAAALVMTVGLTGAYLGFNRTDTTVPAEVASELQSVSDFCNGNDLSQEIESYAFYQGDLSE